MGRWQPNARGRLERAALELFTKRGYEQTTVAEIAARAGLTERTFFRHFADKREVLFGGAALLHERFVEALEDSPNSLSTMEIVGRAIETAAALIQGRRDFSRQRQRIIAANAELQERERIKLASLAEALAGALRRRGVTEPAATLAAEMGIAVFRVAFERWLDATDERDLTKFVREGLDELRIVTAGR